MAEAESDGFHYRTPGVYCEKELPHQDAVLRSGVPLFVGFTRNGQPTGEKRGDKEAKVFRLASWDPLEFEQRVGHPLSDSFLNYAVRGFFENGGEYCVVVPVRLHEDQPSLTVLTEAFRTLFGKDETGRRGFLEDIEDADLVCVPDIMMPGIRASQEDVFELQRQVLEYCKDMGDRFAILDALPIGDGAQPVVTSMSRKDIERPLQHWRELSPTEGALYFPWIRVDALLKNPHDFVPPCGHVAGVYARTDTQLGVHKAPANEIVEGVTDLEVQLTDKDQDGLNDVGVNCLRSFPGRGIRVWGARTLSRQLAWRYVNVRRLFLTLIRWIERNMQDLVFEPNGPPLWNRVRDRLGSYCYTLFQRGALKGRSPDEAFFVKCDAETNPLTVREAGQLICDVGLAAITPAEFVVVRISHSAAGVTASMPTGA